MRCGVETNTQKQQPLALWALFVILTGCGYPTKTVSMPVESTNLENVGGEGVQGKVVTDGLDDPDSIHLTHERPVPLPPAASTLPPLPPPSPPQELPVPVAFSQVVCIHNKDIRGSGFIVAPGYILTAEHVVSPASAITAHFHDGSFVPGTVLSASPALDLALVQIPLREGDPPREGASPLLFAAEGTGTVGMVVRSIGCPLGFSHSLAQGIISAPEREIKGRPVLQTDTAVNPGNSGGPLLNSRGEVIGVVLGLFQEARGIAFALPGREAKQFLGKTFFQMGTRMAQAKRYPEAARLLTQSIFFWPQSAKTHNNLGEVYRRTKDATRAEQAYTRAMELDPNYADGHFNLGILYDTLLPNPKLATYHYRRYLEQASGSSDAAQVRRRLTVLEGQKGQKK